MTTVRSELLQRMDAYWRAATYFNETVFDSADGRPLHIPGE